MKAKKILKVFLIPICILVFISLVWTVFAFIGRVSPRSVIPAPTVFHLSISNPMRLLDGILNHKSLEQILAIPELALAASVINDLKGNPVLENRLVRLAARGGIELVMLPGSDNANANTETILAVWDMGILSPLLRILPTVSRFVDIENLYYVSSGQNSRFEFRMDDTTFFIGPYRNLLFITNSLPVYEERSSRGLEENAGFNFINPSLYDAALRISPQYINLLLAEQDAVFAQLLQNVEFGSMAEAGISIYSEKLEFSLTASLTSEQDALNSLISRRSQVPGISERLPASVQYAAVLSAGTLEELIQAAMIFSGPAFIDAYNSANSAARTILRMNFDELLFSWSGNEIAVFGMEGRSHPVIAILIDDERRRQDVFNRAFRSIAIREDIRLSLDGVRIPRIEVPEFLQSLLRRWDIFLPSPFYIIHDNYLLMSESAEALLAAQRAMQRNDVLPRNAEWRNIAGGRSAVSALKLYYSLDLSMPFFLRRNTTLSHFIGLYRQGLVRVSFDRGLVNLSLSLIPGIGSGVTLIDSVVIDTAVRPSNRVYGAGEGDALRIFISAGNTVLSFNPADGGFQTMTGPGQHWIIPAEGSTSGKAWVVSSIGRVTLVDDDMEAVQGFPIITGLRLSAMPAAFNGRLYLTDYDGKVYSVDERGNFTPWETEFFAAMRSPPSFLSIASRGGLRHLAAVYPRSILMGEIYLLNTDGRILPSWPAPILLPTAQDDESPFFSAGLGFGSPLLFEHNNNVFVAFVNQTGELIVYNENAVPLSPFPLHLNRIFFLQPVFDGEFLWLVSSEGTLFRISLCGEFFYHRIPGLTVEEEGNIMLFDVDGDGVMEIFITGEGNALHAFTRHFRSLESFPLPMWGRPHFVETSQRAGGRRAAIFGIGMDRQLHHWQFR